MAHDYFRCKTCGCVWRVSKGDSLGLETMFDTTACVNVKCKGVNIEATSTKTFPFGLTLQQLTKKMLQKKGNALLINSPVTYNYVTFSAGKMKIGDDMTRPTTDLTNAIDRLNQGKPLEADVNNRAHLHDGGPFKNIKGDLPIKANSQTYYTEYGVHSSSRGWEKNLSSERLVTGKCGELYYSSKHYKAGSWFVFSPFYGNWTAFQC